LEIDANFFRDFFVEYLLRNENMLGMKIKIAEMFLPIPIKKLDDFTDKLKFKAFIDFTNLKMDEHKVVKLEFIEYEMKINIPSFFSSKSFVHFKKISTSICNHVEHKIKMIHKFDEIRNDIVAFAEFAPVSARDIRLNMFKDHLKGFKIKEVDDYLGKMVEMGLLKRKGISDQYVPSGR
jgi:hypothetical protein